MTGRSNKLAGRNLLKLEIKKFLVREMRFERTNSYETRL
jgi:hypothetical protein